MFARNLSQLNASHTNFLKPYENRVLTTEQKEDCFYCMGCDVEMLDADKDFVAPHDKSVFCCAECYEEYIANK
jgi:hypothetical protein